MPRADLVMIPPLLSENSDGRAAVTECWRRRGPNGVGDRRWRKLGVLLAGLSPLSMQGRQTHCDSLLLVLMARNTVWWLTGRSSNASCEAAAAEMTKQSGKEWTGPGA